LVVHLQQWWPLDRPTRGKNLRYCNCNFYQNWRGKSWKICSKHFKVVKIFKNHGESWWINQWSSRFLVNHGESINPRHGFQVRAPDEYKGQGPLAAQVDSQWVWPLVIEK
jgi:hypothetical protein